MNEFLTWLQAALVRAGRQAAQVAVSMLPTAAMITEVNWTVIAGTAALSAILSLLTSIVSLPEVNGAEVPWTHAMGIRTLRTMAQAAIALIPAGVTITAVDWKQLALTVALAGVSCILTSIATPLPEAGFFE